MIDPAALKEAKRLRKQAAALVEVQRNQRGWTKTAITVDGKKKPALMLGTYEPTYENECRAATIVSLRRRAARLEHPL